MGENPQTCVERGLAIRVRKTLGLEIRRFQVLDQFWFSVSSWVVCATL